jgi:hypothetical protein
MCCPPSYVQVIFTIGFLKVDNKSIAWDSVAGPGEDLGNFILQFCNKKGLIVQDLQLKEVIETKTCEFSFCLYLCGMFGDYCVALIFFFVYND